MAKVWFITGARRGIGRSITETVLKHGDSVVATTRNENDLNMAGGYAGRFLNLRLDVANDTQEQVDNVVKQVIERFGRIDVLVNNAGHGRITNFEETSEENIKEIFELNLFGLMRVTRAVLPIMRKQKNGHIFNIASAAGYGAGPVAYHTSKFAVTGFSTCLAFEMEPFGIKVTNVAPGLFRTSFYDKGAMRTEIDIHIPDYDKNRWQDDFVANNSHHEQRGNPEKLSELIYKVSSADNSPLHLPIGKDAVDTVETFITSLANDVNRWKEEAKNTEYKE